MPRLISRSTVDRVREKVRRDFNSSEGAHDYEHIRRVAELADFIVAREGGDRSVAEVAALVHDYHRLMPKRGLGSPADAARAVIEKVLQESQVPVDATFSVLSCVGFTDKYHCAGDRLDAPSPEAAAVRDADNLDAIGAIGIARAFTFGAHLNEPIWIDDIPLRDHYEHGAAPSVLHHFHEKLLHLAEEMGTSTGKQLAQDRHEYVLEFSRRLRNEWSPAASL